MRGIKEFIFQCEIPLKKPCIYTVFSPLFAHSQPSVTFVFSLFLSADNNSAIIAVFCFICFACKCLAAVCTSFKILRLCNFSIQPLIQRQHSYFKPFADNMRICNNLRTHTYLSVIKQNTISVIIITAFLPNEFIYTAALLWCQR